jgi:hypothetical protein
MVDDALSAELEAIRKQEQAATPDHSHLIGKLVRTVGFGPKATVAGRLESCEPIPGSDCIAVWIRRRSGTRVYVGGRFRLERVPR